MKDYNPKHVEMGAVHRSGLKEKCSNVAGHFRYFLMFDK